MSRADNRPFRCMAIGIDGKEEEILVDVVTILASDEDAAKTEFIIDNAEALKGKEVELIVQPFRCDRL